VTPSLRAVAVLAGMASTLGFASQAHAYKLVGQRWPQRVINVSTEAPRYAKPVRRAVKLWNRARLGVRFRVTQTSQARVVFRYSKGRGAGSTGCEGVAGGTGAGYPGIDFTVLGVSVVRTCRSRRLRDLAAMHELGHVLGLGHENRRCTLMNSNASAVTGLGVRCPGRGRTARKLRRTFLTRDDKRGVRRLYGRPFVSERSSRPLFNSTVSAFGDGTGSAVVGATLANAALSFAWDFGDPASGAANRAAGRTAQHGYGAPGTYTITLSVIDSGVVVATRTEPALIQ
jgi:predicted Zn-dependent protease